MCIILELWIFLYLTYFVVNMCNPSRHPDIHLQAHTSGHIQSQNYPSPSPDTTNEACTVKLLVNDLVSVLFTVDGNFSIPESNGNCQHDARIWIGGNNYADDNTCLFCGTRSSGYELRQILANSNTWQNGITIGYRFNSWADPKRKLFFRIMYTGQLSY